MQLNHLAEVAVGQLFGRLIRRILIALVFTTCLVVALYHFTVAGMLALDIPYGPLNTHLIVGAIYAAVAIAAVAVWWQQSRAPRLGAGNTLSAPREMQLIMLVEAVMLGYELARKAVRSR